ncbi:MAG TPA: prolyl oligopeptidase family serine peptidase [Pyrinomonadaceae bacterium]|nr:prolyl oligopeptidase family serine peptidase [Pyrinomonadaceae bacterium]
MRRATNSFKLILVALVLSLPTLAAAQQINRDEIIAALEKDGCVTLTERKVKICKDDYSSDGKLVEAVSIRPLAEGKFPGLLLIPGHQGRATMFITIGIVFAGQGFASLSVGQPGSGKTQVELDFVGPKTVKAMIAGYEKFKHEPYVDSKKMGIFGYSRGGMAAALMATKLKDLKAVVLGAAVYDFKKAYDDVKIEGIRKNMMAETGMSEKAVKERSAVLHLKNLTAPVLILHTETDENVPVNQAYLLRDRLTELKKDFEIKIFPQGKHGWLTGDLIDATTDFFNRRLKG